ncbi:aryl-sulfate sulfotransferase N-terminal domain-containing protein, partial [Salmonella enterica]|uniref:aryl-sulfate sulfotransferase N-terminal domain-containing protein n=1 Tax=Salmonella enterica TaxID=28901 RepID=UPI001BAF8AC0
TIENEIEENTYTIDSPYISLDPYGNAPLTEVTAFETENPTRAEVTIASRTEETTITHDFGEMTTDHTLPILGL